MTATLVVMTNTKEIDDVLRSWEAWQRGQGLSENTISNRESVMRHFFEATGAGPLEISSTHVIGFVGRRGLSKASRSTYHRYISAYSRWLLRTDQRIEDPTVKTPTPQQPRGVPRPIGGTELPLIIAAASRQRTRMMIYLAAFQGLRVHEIAKFRGEDINLAEGNLTVRGKGDKLAVLPLHSEVAELSRYLPAKGYWFTNRVGSEIPVNPSSITKTIGRVCARAGFDRTAHQFRHWYATALLESGVDIRYVQELMRHESLSTTQIYTKVSEEKLREAIRGLHITAGSVPADLHGLAA